MPFSSSSMMKKKTHFFFRSMVEALGLFLVIFALKGVDSQGDDTQVMNDLKKSLVLPTDVWTESQYCDWRGISCNQNRVTRIQIKDDASQPAISMSGSLPSSFNNLTALQHLEFRGAQIKISGALPTLKGLTSLEVVLISENNFTSIPDDFFEELSSLTVVAMDKLPLAAGPIPSSLQTCSALTNFSANYANINGKIPDFFNGDNFPSLQEIHLVSNNLEGGLPSNLSRLTSLTSLWLSGNNLSGPIDVMQTMTALTQVWLNMNLFTGPLPDFTGLQSLSDLNLRDNQFTGPVPVSLRTLKSLRVLNLTNNFLQGDTPVFDKSVEVDMLTGQNCFCLDSPGPCSGIVNTLLLIVKNLGYPRNLAEKWTGNNPCSSWLGITCQIGGEITVINFRKMNLTGTISPNFSSILSLKTINLADNNLYGTIPKELTNLPHLITFNVSNNRLSGIPPPFKSGVLHADGNPDIGKILPLSPPPGAPSGSSGGSDNSPSGGNSNGSGGNKSSVSVGVIVGAVIGVLFVILLIGLVGFCLYKKKQKSGRVPNAMVVHPHYSGSDPDMVKITVAGSNVNVGAVSETYSLTSSGPSDIQMVEAGNMVISIQVLRNVTNNFSEENVLGRGGFGTVYKGELHDGTKIAVKRMESGVMGSKGLTEFKSEIAVLNKVRHRHLVSLIGYCLEGNERILVYEYMPQGTLSEHLFNWKDEGLKPLEWTRRLSIALDVARGVEYLHGLASQSFIHRDLKPSNILLGDDMRAKVADFGLVRLAPEGKASIETRLAGTFGYLAPEYAATGRVTTKVDVYAFGVILMELITGRRALDESQPEESMHLVTWFRRMSINKDTSRKAIDPTLDMDEEALPSISTVSELAGYCCSREPHQRPDMGHVVNVLSSLVELWKPSDTDPEDIYAIDMELSLAQTLKKWQAFDGDTSMDRSTFLASVDNTQTSIPTRPSGFAESFTSADGR